MAKVVGVEIGNTITRICEMDFRTKNPKVYKYFCIPTPQGALEDGFVRDNAAMVPALKRALTENKIKTKQVVFTVTSSKIVTREITVPPMKEAQVGGYVKSNANDYFPIDLSNYEIAHVVLGVDKVEAGGNSFRVMAIAAGKDLILGYSKLAAECGLRLICVDYAGNSIYQIMKSEGGADAKLVVKVEDSSTIASIIGGGNMMLQRNLSHGFERAIKALMESSDFYDVGGEGEAFRKMCQEPCIKVVLNENTKVLERDEVYGETEAEAESRKRITGTFSQLVGNLLRMIELYSTKNADNPVKEIVLVGLGSEIKGLSKLLANELGMPTKVIRNLGSISVFQSMSAESMGKYVGVIGAGIEPLGLLSEDSKEKASKKVNYPLLTGIVAAVFVVAALSMAGLALIPYYQAVEEEQRLKAEEAQYSEAEVVYNRYTATSVLYGEVKKMARMTLHSNDELVAFLMELEKKLPTDIALQSISSDETECLLTFIVPEMEEVAKILQILRGFDTALDVSVDAVTEMTVDLSSGGGEDNMELPLSQEVIDAWRAAAEEEGITLFEEEQLVYYGVAVHFLYYPIELEESPDANAIETANADATAAQ
ncbi:MAG: pilus assembly protein PilM [Bacteroidales bacterium]|nr:pilus assembly protein PilM [Lachnoclostridium sp.]MCM1385063.1 pilus assembly protein PilM [Lachnoclostridium sp.]MCM1465305.1 pilus assembly protein PilM [Bacteroidales bacterium]